jgi:hypothetical protein
VVAAKLGGTHLQSNLAGEDKPLIGAQIVTRRHDSRQVVAQEDALLDSDPCVRHVWLPLIWRRR